MTATTIEAMQTDADTPSLVRKMGKALGYLAPMTIDLPTALTDTTGAPLPLIAGFLSVGIVNPDGYTFGSDMDKADIDALGYAQPVRSDITKITKTVEFTPLESFKQHMLELKYGLDLSAVTQAASGEITFDEPAMPVNSEYRLVVIGADGPLSDQWIIGLGFPRVKLSAVDSEQWQKEGAVAAKITLDVFTDDTLGTPVRHYIAGTGAAAAKADLGFTAAT